MKHTSKCDSKSIRQKLVIYAVTIAIIILAIVAIVIISGRIEKSNMENFDQVVPTLDEQIKEEAMIIQTDYCTLYYPKKWQNNIRTNNIDEKTYDCVQFYGCIVGKKEQHIFDIVFGESEGTLLGYINKEDKITPIYLKGFEFRPDDTWTTEEKIIIMSMQEDANYILGKLKKEPNYMSVSE